MSKAVALSEYSLFAVYDLAIKRWCNRVTDTVQGRVPTVYASPMRAFAEVKKVIDRNTDPANGNEIPNPGLVGTPKTPLPFISVVRTAVNPRPGRTYPSPNLFRRTLPPTDSSARMRWKARPPIPLWIDYQLEIWTKTVGVQSQFVEAFVAEFCRDIAYGEANISREWGKHVVPIHLRGFTDIGEQEGGELGDRVVRYSVALQVEAYKFFDWSEDLVAKTVQIDQNQMVGISTAHEQLPHINSLYIQGAGGEWFKFFLDNGGEMYLFPDKPPATPKIYTATNIVFDDGFFMKDSSSGKSYLVYQKNGNSYTTYAPTIWDNSALDVIVQKEQNLLIGGSGNGEYVQYGVSRRWVPLERTRVLAPEVVTP